VSCEQSAGSQQQHDINQLLTVWNTPTTMSNWSHLPNRVDASGVDDSAKLDSAFVYSTDPDHEPEGEEVCAAEEPVAGSEKVLFITVDKQYCCYLLPMPMAVVGVGFCCRCLSVFPDDL